MGAHAAGLAAPPIAASRLTALDPRAKLLGLLAVTVAAVSAPPRLWPVYLGCAGLLAAVAATGGVRPGELWRRVRVVLPLVLAAAVALPLARTGGTTHALGPLTLHETGLELLGAVAAKAAVGTTSAALLAATTPFPSLLAGLRALRVPRLLVLVAAFMYRYLAVAGGEARRTRAAMTARGYAPRHALRAGALGRAAATLFLRSHARGERVYRSMLARGYRGSLPAGAPLRFGAADAAFLAALAGAALVLRLAVGAGA